MARNRFQKLMSHVHFVNNLEVREKEKTDKLWRLQPWLDSLQNSLKKLPQEEHSSVDEVMVPFKGKSSVKQYMRNKPHKWGFKLWGREEASGTLSEFDVYQGASGQQSKPGQLSKTSEVVLSMYRYHIKSRRWYMYIFFYTLNMMVVNAWLRHRHHARLLKISCPNSKSCCPTSSSTRPKLADPALGIHPLPQSFAWTTWDTCLRSV